VRTEPARASPDAGRAEPAPLAVRHVHPQAQGPLVAAFAAAPLDLGTGPAFLAALSAADGSLHLIQVRIWHATLREQICMT
jgi:hypothetical protein